MRLNKPHGLKKEPILNTMKISTPLLLLLLLTGCIKSVAPPAKNGILRYTTNTKSVGMYIKENAMASIKTNNGTILTIERKKPDQQFKMYVSWAGGVSHGVFCGKSDVLQNWVVYNANGKVYKAKEYNGQVTRYSRSTIDIWFDAVLETTDGEQLVITNGRAVDVAVNDMRY